MPGLDMGQLEALTLYLARPWGGAGGDEVAWRLRPWRWLSDGRVVEWQATVSVHPTDGTGFGEAWTAAVNPQTGGIAWPAGVPLPPAEWVEDARRIVAAGREVAA